MNVLFLFHTYTFYPLERNTYQFDFKLHYQAYIIFMSSPLVYLFIFYFLNSHCIPICFNFSSWAAICFNKLVIIMLLLLLSYVHAACDSWTQQTDTVLLVPVLE